MQKIVIITDSWEPQANGIVRTYQNLKKELEKKDYDVTILHPTYLHYNDRSPLPKWCMIKLPFYRDIKVIVNPWLYKDLINSFAFLNYKIHITTEGPLGLYAKYILDKRKFSYTTSYHTKFPELFESYTGFSSKLLYKYFKWFHRKSKSVMVSTEGTKNLLVDKGFKNVKVWKKGVNQALFSPKYRKPWGQGFILCVSRASKEKNVDEFCNLQFPNKVFVGDGPYLEELKQKYPFIKFTGSLEGLELARYFASADAFIFPSKSDTFGITLLESISCGTPVLAYDQPGPKEVIIENINGCIVHNDKTYGFDNTLDTKIKKVLEVSRETTRKSAIKWTWESSMLDFLDIIK